jgi:hypothetical protein
MRKTRHLAERDDGGRLGHVIDFAVSRVTDGRFVARAFRVATTAARPVTDVRHRDATGVDAGRDAVEDTWIDEYQWLAGFPSKWGDRGGGWFRGF